MLHQDNYFAVSVKLNFCERHNRGIDNEDKAQSFTDTGNEFTECQTPRKKLQSIGISYVNIYAFMKTLKNDISEAYKVQVGCFMSNLVRLETAIQEK